MYIYVYNDNNNGDADEMVYRLLTGAAGVGSQDELTDLNDHLLNVLSTLEYNPNTQSFTSQGAANASATSNNPSNNPSFSDPTPVSNPLDDPVNGLVKQEKVTQDESNLVKSESTGSENKQENEAGNEMSFENLFGSDILPDEDDLALDNLNNLDDFDIEMTGE